MVVVVVPPRLSWSLLRTVGDTDDCRYDTMSEPSLESGGASRHAARTASRAVLLTLVVLFVALLAYGLLSKAPDKTIDSALADGRSVAAPGFALRVLERGKPGPLSDVWSRAAADGTVDLRELRGTPLALNFWASWCDPCRSEAPLLERGWKQARAQGVLLVGLDQQDAPDNARAFIREFGLTFPHVREAGRDSARRWGVTGIPETFFIDARGRIVGHVIGVVNAQQFDAGVRAARAGKPVPSETGGAQGGASGP